MYDSTSYKTIPVVGDCVGATVGELVGKIIGP